MRSLLDQTQSYDISYKLPLRSWFHDNLTEPEILPALGVASGHSNNSNNLAEQQITEWLRLEGTPGGHLAQPPRSHRTT